MRNEQKLRLKELSAGFARVNRTIRHGSVLTVEANWRRQPRRFRAVVDELVAANADELDEVRVRLLENDGTLWKEATVLNRLPRWRM